MHGFPNIRKNGISNASNVDKLCLSTILPKLILLSLAVVILMPEHVITYARFRIKASFTLGRLRSNIL